ncbi:hypothetical protein EX30DRAFT_195067 [Ascodesmis nigricans]|uniref:Uncharacterized protein n=1 Tax=Ascodesmis nigricans TaxID=341454 RepID=A0A4S2ML61_9PEZI|nr:hypothetical protein EX30DRAFT_195067 [Ascodesmis nigricans]
MARGSVGSWVERLDRRETRRSWFVTKSRGFDSRRDLSRPPQHQVPPSQSNPQTSRPLPPTTIFLALTHQLAHQTINQPATRTSTACSIIFISLLLACSGGWLQLTNQPSKPSEHSVNSSYIHSTRRSELVMCMHPASVSVSGSCIVEYGAAAGECHWRHQFSHRDDADVAAWWWLCLALWVLQLLRKGRGMITRGLFRVC